MSESLEEAIRLERLRDVARREAYRAVSRKQSVVHYPGPFSVGPRIVRKCLCEDGIGRSAYCSAAGADTFYSIPARVSVRGRTVSGYVTADDVDGARVWLFVAYRYGANAGAILESAVPALVRGDRSA